MKALEQLTIALFVAVVAGCQPAGIEMVSSSSGRRFRPDIPWEDATARAAQARAMLDFDCPSDHDDAKAVAQLKPFGDEQTFFLVRACGHEARYACIMGEYCFREPSDSQPPARPTP